MQCYQWFDCFFPDQVLCIRTRLHQRLLTVTGFFVLIVCVIFQIQFSYICITLRIIDSFTEFQALVVIYIPNEEAVNAVLWPGRLRHLDTTPYHSALWASWCASLQLYQTSTKWQISQNSVLDSEQGVVLDTCHILSICTNLTWDLMVVICYFCSFILLSILF